MAHLSVVVLSTLVAAALAYPSLSVSQGFPAEAAALQREDSWHTQNSAHRRIAGISGASSSHPDLTQVITRSPALGPDYNVRQEPPPSGEELQAPRRRREATAEDSEAQADDDSDMYLEPDEEAGPVKQQAKPSEEVHRHLEPEEETEAVRQPSDVVARYEYGMDSPGPDSQGYPQHFFPSFAPVFSLGHSRPPQLFHQEPEIYKPRAPQQLLRAEFNPFRTYRESNFQVPIADTDEEASSTNALLGSGNFGVIRGGTYYNDEDRNSLSPYYNNGHGRPGYGNPRPQKYNGGDFFANFRDFADINTPTKASFSEYVIVYVNKNGTETTEADPTRPKNIIEQLSLLDKEDSTPEKKVSAHKRKLGVLRREQEGKLKKRVLRKKETVKDLHEPLLALS